MKRLKLLLGLIAFGSVAFLMFWATPRAPKSYDDPLDAEFHRHEVFGRDLLKHARLIDAATRSLLAEDRGVSAFALRESRKSVRIDPETGVAAVMFRFGGGDEDFDDKHVAIMVVEVSPDLMCRFRGLVDFHAAR